MPGVRLGDQGRRQARSRRGARSRCLLRRVRGEGTLECEVGGHRPVRAWRVNAPLGLMKSAGRRGVAAGGLLLLCVAALAAAFGDKPVTNEKTVGDDRQAILAHINGIFQAYFRGDREAIRRGHTEDWVGFPVTANRIVRGIDGYMKSADAALVQIRGFRHEMLDTEIRQFGDVAVVFYVAREWIRDDTGREKTILLRSVDIYRREPGGWNQCGSNIMVLPDER